VRADIGFSRTVDDLSLSSLTSAVPRAFCQGIERLVWTQFGPWQHVPVAVERRTFTEVCSARAATSLGVGAGRHPQGHRSVAQVVRTQTLTTGLRTVGPEALAPHI
jgi:hypothetical protein